MSRSRFMVVSPSPVPVSILVPIRNEVGNLSRCLASVTWAAEVWVVDSHSTDGSIALAEQWGAKVVQFDYQPPFPKKKNWALANVPFAHEWVFILDADEVLAPELEAEIRALVTAPGEARNGFWINRRFFFLGRWLRHAYFPNWNLRLLRHRVARFERMAQAETQSGDNEVHEHLIVEGATGRLRGLMDHYAFPDIATFVEKHNRYSNWEARVAVEQASGAGQLQDGSVRGRRRLKRLVRRLPFRPTLRFLWVYVIQRGFLDGYPGYLFARLHATYEFLSAAKTWELRHVSNVPPTPPPAPPSRPLSPSTAA